MLRISTYVSVPIDGRLFSCVIALYLQHMVTIPVAVAAALSMPEATSNQHMGTPDFRVKDRVFATLKEEKAMMVVKLTPEDQSVFCAFDNTVMFPVPGGWGKKGWTFVNLQKVRKTMLLDALTTAWKTVAPKTMVTKYFPVAK